MLTRMTDENWEMVVQVFRAVRSRRGDKGRNDRRFLEAVHYFCVHRRCEVTQTAVVDAIRPETWSDAGKPGTEARLSGMQLSRPLCESQDSTGRWIGCLGAGRS